MTPWRWAPALAAAITLAGCGAGGEEDAGGEPYRPPSLAGLRDDARAALARYDEALGGVPGTRRFVPVGSLTDIVGELEPENHGLKEALSAGRLVPAAALPAAPDRPGKITWADGRSRSVSVLSAADALAAHRQDAAGCGGCAPVDVTGARPVAMLVHTTTGQVTVPGWEYTVRGTAVRVLYAAVGDADTVTVTAPPWDPHDPPDGHPFHSATTVQNSRQLTVSFTGARGPADESCGEDYHAEAIESGNAVVVILVVERRHDGDEVCPLIGYSRTETVSLARPVGERAVLSAQHGMPVAVTTTR